MADFIADWTTPGYSSEGPIIEVYWTIYCDGAWGCTGAEIATVIKAPFGVKMRYAAKLKFCMETDKCTNNIAEYEAVLLRLGKIRALGVQRCKIQTDSKVVADQEYVAREPQLAKYLLAVRSMDKYFKGFDIEYIERKRNDEADELAKAASRMQVMPLDMLYEIIQEPSIKVVQQDPKVVNAVFSEDWRSSIKKLFLPNRRIGLSTNSA